MPLLCPQPCFACAPTLYFSQCTSCLSTETTLNNMLCIKSPTQIIQFVCSFLLILFIIPSLTRKRCVTLWRIFDAIQFVAYFKYLNGYIKNRQNFLYLSMRSAGNWSEGWSLLSITDDVTLPVWTIEQKSIDKTLRIFAIWLAVVIIMCIFGLLKTMTGDSPQLTFFGYVKKNIPLAFTIGFYINVQDMALLMGNAFFSIVQTNTLSGTYAYIQFAVAIIFAIIIVLILIWMFDTINFNYSSHTQFSEVQKQIYPHIHMFLFNLDYDIFPTYQLTNLPANPKNIKKYSNLRIIEVFKKIFYSFLIVSYLYTTESQQENLFTNEIYSILGFLIFMNIIWYVSLPYDLTKEIFQFLLCIFADVLVIVILVLSFKLPDSQIVNMIICLVLFGLAILSIIAEFVQDVYKIIPVDLYETGLQVIIEDKRLLKEIEERKKMQQQNEKRLRQMQEYNQRLKQELEAKKKDPTNTGRSSRNQRLRDDSQQSLPVLPYPQRNKSSDLMNLQQSQQKDEVYRYGQIPEQNQKTSMNSDQLAELYKIDEHKRRKIYQFNKKSEFTYSNRVEY